MSLKKRCDEVIDWYNESGQPRSAIETRHSIHTVRRFARKNKVRGGPYLYRGYEIRGRMPQSKPQQSTL